MSLIRLVRQSATQTTGLGRTKVTLDRNSDWVPCLSWSLAARTTTRQIRLCRNALGACAY
ncbi:MAG: hypothetical protein EOO63_04160 [Hymenobacter sp.]|nr:MAG: hypothetical protein EOO63_04160 [Hymenobacter sp.]